MSVRYDLNQERASLARSMVLHNRFGISDTNQCCFYTVSRAETRLKFFKQVVVLSGGPGHKQQQHFSVHWEEKEDKKWA